MRNLFPAFLIIRILAICLYLGGMALLLFPATELFEIKPVNWHEDFVRKNAQWKKALQTLTTLTDESYTSGDDLQKRFAVELSEFIEQRTKNSIIEASGPEWEGFFAELAATKTSNDADPAWRDANGFFRTSMVPLNSIRNQFNDEKSFYYLRITGTDKNQEYLTLSLKKAGELMFKAPAHLAFPLRHTGCWLMLAGIIIYLIQSSQPQQKKQVRLGYARTSRGPDFIAALFAPVFIFIGAAVCGQIGLDPLSNEWFLISGIFWLFSLLFASSWLFTAYYRSFSVDFADHGVTYNTLFGSVECEAGRIKAIQPEQYNNPWWMRGLLAIGRLTARSESMRKLYLNKPEPGFKIVTTDNGGPTIPLAGLCGLKDFFQHCQERNIQVDQSLKAYADATDAENNDQPWFITRVFARVMALGAIVMAASGIIATFHVPDPPIKSRTLPGAPFSTLKTAGPSTEELQKKVQRNAELLEEIGKLTVKMQEITDRIEKTTDKQQRQELTEQSSLLLQKIMQLRNQK